MSTENSSLKTTSQDIAQSIAVVDYGMGNLHSAKKALEKASGKNVIVTSNAQTILNAERVVVPGVGAMRDCMAAIREHGLDKVIADVVASGKPVLGICIGMQAFLAHSEENGGVDCLNFFPEKVVSFSNYAEVKNAHLKVPHMGWNRVQQSAHPIWENIDDNSYFYFVHSFCAQVSDTFTVGECEYGVPFSAVMAKDNIVATQFHPEKSSDNGLQLLKNFANWNGK